MTKHHKPEEMWELEKSLATIQVFDPWSATIVRDTRAMLRDIADAAEKDRDGEPKLWGWWKISEPGGVLMVKECPIAWKGMAIPLFTHPKNAAIQPSQQSVHSVSAEKDREDAERYRWLRNDPPLELAVRRKNPNPLHGDCAFTYLDAYILDQAIDAARKASP